MNGRTARAGRYSRLAQDSDRLALLQGRLDRAQLTVDVPERRQLAEYQGVVALAESMQVEDQPAKVSIGELARLAQEARAPTGATARSKPRLLGGDALSGLTAVVLTLRRSVRWGRVRYLIQARLTLPAPLPRVPQLMLPGPLHRFGQRH